MAEFCLDCWNELYHKNDKANKYILSKNLDFCEGCGQWKHVVVMEKKYYYKRKFKWLIFPFKIIYMIFYVIWRILILPYTLYQYYKK